LTNILIHSFDLDVHARAVMWALEALGNPATLWPSGVFPAQQRWAARLCPDGRYEHSVTTGDGGAIRLPEAEVVWNRRALQPVVSDTLGHQDGMFSRRESLLHMRSLMRTVAPDALWINPPWISEADGYKPVQLRTALRTGFRVPDTLFTNDPDTVAAFFDAHDGRIVYKSFRGKNWMDDDKPGEIRAINRTAMVERADLAHRAEIAAAPGIYQQVIDKSHELRVTAMGHSFLAARLHSQDHDHTRLDWRSGSEDITIEPFTLPPGIEALCRRYMELAGLRFGCFDFIVTPEDECVFVEVNQMGQFLWVEDRCPEIPLLQTFCDFLLAADPEFRAGPKQAEVTFKAFHESPAGQVFQSDYKEALERLGGAP